jgi:hypothetical protein
MPGEVTEPAVIDLQLLWISFWSPYQPGGQPSALAGTGNKLLSALQCMLTHPHILHIPSLILYSFNHIITLIPHAQS